MVRVEPIEGPVQVSIPGAYRVGRIRPASFPLPFRLKGDCSHSLALSSPQSIATTVDQDTSEPGCEPIGVVQRAASSPGDQAGVLDGVLRLPVIEQNRSRYAVGPIELVLDPACQRVASV
jgi:hypothetical protein